MDRVLVNSNKKQVYGTQGRVFEKDGIEYWDIKPTKNLNALNKRRQKVGLGTIEKYKKMMNGIINGTIIVG